MSSSSNVFIPSEILCKVLQYLPRKKLANLRLTSKHWKNVIDSHSSILPLHYFKKISVDISEDITVYEYEVTPAWTSKGRQLRKLKKVEEAVKLYGNEMCLVENVEIMDPVENRQLLQELFEHCKNPIKTKSLHIIFSKYDQATDGDYFAWISSHIVANSIDLNTDNTELVPVIFRSILNQLPSCEELIIQVYAYGELPTDITADDLVEFISSEKNAKWKKKFWYIKDGIVDDEDDERFASVAERIYERFMKIDDPSKMLDWKMRHVDMGDPGSIASIWVEFFTRKNALVRELGDGIEQSGEEFEVSRPDGWKLGYRREYSYSFFTFHK